jgi:hypothetical protein
VPCDTRGQQIALAQFYAKARFDNSDRSAMAFVWCCRALSSCDHRLSAASNLMLEASFKENMKKMARVEGVDPRQTPFFMRQVFKKVRKMLGRDLTPQKIQARVPRLFWFNILGEWLLGQKAGVPARLRALVLLRTAVRVACPF